MDIHGLDTRSNCDCDDGDGKYFAREKAIEERRITRRIEGEHVKEFKAEHHRFERMAEVGPSFSFFNVPILRCLFFSRAFSILRPRFSFVPKKRRWRYQVFAAFIDTNAHKGKHYTFDAILEIKDKTLFLFEYAAAPYLATVDYERWHDGPRVILRLVNGAFLYVPKCGEPVGRPGGDDWVALPVKESLSCCKSITDAVCPRFDRAKVFYSFGAQRTDFLFVSVRQHAVPYFFKHLLFFVRAVSYFAVAIVVGCFRGGRCLFF